MHGGRCGHSEPGGRQVDARDAHREGLDEDLHGGPPRLGHHAPFRRGHVAENLRKGNGLFLEWDVHMF